MGRNKRNKARVTPHPRNRYAEAAPDFAALAAKYPSFAPYVRLNREGRGSIDWCDYDATRELTRVLLHHDYGLTWWIPDGHLCPTVTNRANYIHWIEDLLHDFPAPGKTHPGTVSGVDIGTGASCIYPLLGASMHGWKFLATDITQAAIRCARRNVEDNPQLQGLIQVRSAAACEETNEFDEKTPVGVVNEDKQRCARENVDGEEEANKSVGVVNENEERFAGKNVEGLIHIESATCDGGEEASKVVDNTLVGLVNERCASENVEYNQSLIHAACDAGEEANKGDEKILVGVVEEGEEFDFCMCNPPFFESMDEAGLNPRTACGGTEREMVCPGGEAGFVSRLISDSVQLGCRIHWYTTMVGKKGSLKTLSAQLRTSGATMLKTTEFVQGRTSRWGLAWTFNAAPTKAAAAVVRGRKDGSFSFMLDGMQRQCSALDVLHGLTAHLEGGGATCQVDAASFMITGTFPGDENDENVLGKRTRDNVLVIQRSSGERSDISSSVELRFKLTLFQQSPGCLLVKGSVFKGEGSSPGRLLSVLESAEAELKERFSSRVRQKL